MTHILTIHNYSTKAIELVFEFFSSLHKSYIFSKEVRVTINELSKLSDRELNDIGITRGEIYSIAVDQAKATELHMKSNSNLKGWV